MITVVVRARTGRSGAKFGERDMLAEVQHGALTTTTAPETAPKTVVVEAAGGRHEIGVHDTVHAISTAKHNNGFDEVVHC